MNRFMTIGNADTKKWLETEIAAVEEGRMSKEERYNLFKTIDPKANKQLAEEYAAVRIDKININVWQKTIAMDFAEVIDLSDDELAVYVTSIRESIGVTEIGTMGGQAQKQWTGDDQATWVRMHFVQSEPYYMPIESPNVGLFNLSEKMNEQCEHDIAVKHDTDVWTLLTAGLGVFPARAMQLDSNIVTANVPTTNDINLSVEAGLTKELFISIFDHFDRLGKVVKNIYIPSISNKDIRRWVSVVSGIAGSDISKSIDPATQREIFQLGKPSSMFGEAFNIVPLRTLPANYLWVSTTSPAMSFYRKPGQAKSWLLTEREHLNETGFSSRQTVGLIQPEPYTPNYARVKFA